MSQKDAIEFRNTVTRGEAAGFLESLAKSLREGSSLLESGDKSLGIQIGSEVKIDLEVESDPEKGKGAIELSLSWRLTEPSAAPPSLVIVPGALVPAAAED